MYAVPCCNMENAALYWRRATWASAASLDQAFKGSLTNFLLSVCLSFLSRFLPDAAGIG
jgi:hypothetical protein